LAYNTQCAKDCGPCNHACKYGSAAFVNVNTMFVNVNAYWHAIFTWLKLYFNVRVIIFYMCEGSSQPIANQLSIQKIMVSIFLTTKATIFDTHGIFWLLITNVWHKEIQFTIGSFVKRLNVVVITIATTSTTVVVRYFISIQCKIRLVWLNQLLVFVPHLILTNQLNWVKKHRTIFWIIASLKRREKLFEHNLNKMNIFCLIWKVWLIWCVSKIMNQKLD